MLDIAAGVLSVDPILVAVLGGVFSTALTALSALFSMSIGRNVKNVDKAIQDLAKDIKDTSNQVIEMARKVAVLEYQVQELHQRQRG